ncbi:MAG: hypothetical protein ABIY70_10385 [Capsulimonas sp.]|uniref:hypothetical protein n=1 Tax=Capsulimonas sp. TaxID=2494211 RepID=UPI0032639D25
MKLRSALVLTGLTWGASTFSLSTLAAPIAANTTIIRVAGPASISAQSETTTTTKGIRVKWAAVKDVKYYNVYRDDFRIACPTSTTTTLLDTTSDPKTRHAYKVTAFVGDKPSNYSSIVYAQYIAPVAKTNLTGGALVAGPASLTAALEDTPAGIGVRVNWSTVNNAAYYNIYRDDVRVACQSPLTFLDRNAEPGKVHYYKISAYVDATKETAFSNIVAALFNPVTEVPASLTAQPRWAVSCSTTGQPMPHMILSWNTVDNAVSYSVYRNNVLLKDALSGSSLIDMSTESGNTYTYTVRTNGKYGQSANSNAAIAVAPSPPLTANAGPGNVLLPPANVAVKNMWVGAPTDSLAWSPVAGALAYNIYQYGDLIAAGVSGTSYQLATSEFSKGLTYTVTAVDMLGMESIPSSLSFSYGAKAPGVALNYIPKPLVVPTSVKAVSQWNNSKPRVALTWLGNGADDFYNVYRDGVAIASGIWSLSYFDEDVSIGQVHKYQISAYSAVIDYPETSGSTPVSVTVAANTLPVIPGVVQVTSVKANDDSAVIFFNAVPGAVDYRIYNAANSGSMKYSGGGLSIEMNGLDPVAGADLVVEAVDKLGPFQIMDGAMGPGAMAMNGVMSVAINGQGDPSNLPRVIARSAVFHATPKAVVLTGSQVFFDNFRNAKPLVQMQTIDPAIAAANHDGPANATNQYVKEYANDKWTIRNYDADMDYTKMFFMSNHFMDTVYDGGTAHKTDVLHNNNATLAMIPKATADISGGRVLHVTFEVDAHFDGRRWCEVQIGAAGDPLIHPAKLDGGLWPTVSGDRFRWEIGKERSDAKQCVQGVETVLNTYTSILQSNVRVNINHVAGINGDMRDLDKRHKFDLYLTQNRYRLVENGVVEWDGPITTPIPFSKMQVYFVHQVYHTGNDRPELICQQLDPYWYNYRPFSDERHWDNMGFEVLTAFPK